MALNGFSQGVLYYWRADTRAERRAGGLKSKTVLKISWKVSSKYKAIKDKAKTTGGATAIAGVGTSNTAEMLLLSLGAAPTSWSLLPRDKF